MTQRNIKQRQKQEHDKNKAFYNYVFIQDPEVVLSFEAKQEAEDRQDEEMAYIKDFDLSLLY